MRIRIAFLLLSLVTWSNAVSSGILDDTKELKGKLIVAAGDVEELRCYSYGKYDCDSWPRNLLRFTNDDICIISESLACNHRCEGLLAVGKDEIPYFFAFEQIGDGFKKYSAKVVECPSRY